MVLDGEIAAPNANGVTHLDNLNEAINGGLTGELRPCGQIRIGIPSRTLWPVLDLLRRPRANGKPLLVEPKLRVSAKFFGSHRGGIIRDGVVREMGLVE